MLKSQLDKSVNDILRIAWEEREPRSVLAAEQVRTGGDAIKYNPATVLYTDLDGSTDLVATKKWWFVAEVFKCFLYCSSRLINNYGGTITSYDGDRVMGIFFGDYQERNAVRCALNINFARNDIINPAIKARYKDANFEVRCVTGIDRGLIRGVRTGVRGDNDLAWIGRAPNLAAKLSELSPDYPTRITEAVYSRLTNDEKTASGNSMWQKANWTTMDDMTIYRSTYQWDTSKIV